jgi:hypothetical protein
MCRKIGSFANVENAAKMKSGYLVPTYSQVEWHYVRLINGWEGWRKAFTEKRAHPESGPTSLASDICEEMASSRP